MKVQNLMRDSIIDEYRIHKLQNVILNIMQHIDELCAKHKIEYYIVGGTALGAVRHCGFIPWDDDLDIAMSRNHYNKFINVCRNELDENLFYFQEGEADWSLDFSKVRLKDTYFEEIEEDKSISKKNRGIYVDVFPLDNVSSNKLISTWQYICGKILLAYSLNKRGYRSASTLKKSVMFMTFPLKVRRTRVFFKNQVQMYKNEKTGFVFFSYEPRFRSAIAPISNWGIPIRVQFENISLLAPSDLNEFLKLTFGDFMKLPSKEHRKPKHLIRVDFGRY